MNFKKVITALIIVLSVIPLFAQNWKPVFKENIPLDSIRLSDPCILADKNIMTYYMTGTGGLLWKSKDLRKWTGPYKVAKTDPNSWMGTESHDLGSRTALLQRQILLLCHVYQQEREN